MDWPTFDIITIPVLLRGCAAKSGWQQVPAVAARMLLRYICGDEHEAHNKLEAYIACIFALQLRRASLCISSSSQGMEHCGSGTSVQQH